MKIRVKLILYNYLIDLNLTILYNYCNYCCFLCPEKILCINVI